MNEEDLTPSRALLSEIAGAQDKHRLRNLYMAHAQTFESDPNLMDALRARAGLVEDFVIENGGRGPWDYWVDLMVYPWEIEDTGHDSYLSPRTANIVHLPRVIHPELESYFVDEFDIGFWPRTTWVGDGNGLVARAWTDDPVVRVIGNVEHPDNPTWKVWCIADGYLPLDLLETGRFLPVRTTTAIGNDLYRARDHKGLEWALDVAVYPAGYFFDITCSDEDAFEAWKADDCRPIRPRNLFRSARQLYRLLSPETYPQKLKDLLVGFQYHGHSIKRRDSLDDADPESKEEADRRYAALGLAYILGRALRKKGPDGKLPDVWPEFAWSIRYDEYSTSSNTRRPRKLIQEAVTRGVLSKPLSNGHRHLTDKGKDLMGEILGGLELKNDL